jgi:hypothetical protein
MAGGRYASFRWAGRGAPDVDRGRAPGRENPQGEPQIHGEDGPGRGPGRRDRDRLFRSVSRLGGGAARSDRSA